MNRHRALLFLVIASMFVLGTSTRTASAFEWPVHEFNTEYNVSAGITAVLFITTTTKKPWFVGLSEICNLGGSHPTDARDTADYIESNLANVGYSVSPQNYFSMIVASSACPDPINGGNAPIGVLGYTRGPGIPSTVITYSNNPSGGTTEGAICAESSTYLGHIVACSTHLFNGSHSTAQAQAEELRNWGSFVYPGKKKVLLGDFNLRPPPPSVYGGTPVPQPFYDNYFEVDQSLNRPTRNTAIKNDFIFGAKNAFYGYGNVTITPLSYSDHYYFVGSFFS